MSLTQSRYNFIYKRKKNENVIYNTFSKALVVLDDEEYRQYEELTFNNDDVEKQLADNGVLTEDCFDEAGFLKYFHYKTKFSNDTLFLTIAPTLDCNFACPYCYENRRQGKMSPEIQDALMSYIQDSIFHGVNNLNISWYGGEPLMYFDVLESLSRKIMAAAEENNCLLSMHLVTNGYLLTQSMIDILDEIGVTKIQITLDGLKDSHDIRRPLKSGKGTFNKILDNLALFADSPIEVLVRMNVDNQNWKDFKGLKEEIDALNNPNIGIYPSPVEDINKDIVNEVSDFMTNEEFDAFALQMWEESQLQPDHFAVMDDRYCFCTAETENCYVVDDLGDFYKCWDEVGRRERRCFNVLDHENINYSNVVRYLAADPFSDEKCDRCTFLPLCFGGCKFQRANLEKSVCGFTQESFEKYLENAYFSKL